MIVNIQYALFPNVGPPQLLDERVKPVYFAIRKELPRQSLSQFFKGDEKVVINFDHDLLLVLALVAQQEVIGW